MAGRRPVGFDGAGVWMRRRVRAAGARAVATVLAVGCAGTTALVPPPPPLGAPTHVDGTPGVQGYVGVGGGLRHLGTLDGGLSVQLDDHVAVDVTTAVGGTYQVWSPGLWVSTASKGPEGASNVAVRVAPLVGVGAPWAVGSWGAVSVGGDVRAQYTWRWADRGALHVTGHYALTRFVDLEDAAAAHPLGAPRNLVASRAHTAMSSLGVDVPVGRVALVVQSGAGFDVAGVVDGDQVSASLGPLWFVALGVRFGRGADVVAEGERLGRSSTLR